MPPVNESQAGVRSETPAEWVSNLSWKVAARGSVLALQHLLDGLSESELGMPRPTLQAVPLG